MNVDLLNSLVWSDDGVRGAGLDFRTNAAADSEGDPRLRLMKSRELIDAYARFWSQRPHFEAARIVELGILDGASLLLWAQVLEPERILGIDHGRPRPGVELERRARDLGLGETVVARWGVAQDDRDGLLSAVTEELATPLDLVIDDASHLYEPTRASFEVLFPLLRSGGLYLIEDWAWCHWEGFRDPDHPWHDEIPLERLIVELVQAQGGADYDLPAPISSVSIWADFFAIERA